MAVIPTGGFYGRLVHRAGEVDHSFLEATGVYFDPAEDPPPTQRAVGRGLMVAALDASDMRRSRMRMFNPRPSHEGLLMTTLR